MYYLEIILAVVAVKLLFWKDLLGLVKTRYPAIYFAMIIDWMRGIND